MPAQKRTTTEKFHRSSSDAGRGSKHRPEGLVIKGLWVRIMGFWVQVRVKR